MRILLTNDDGIQGEGLRMLAEWIKRRGFGETVIAAPRTEQSATSMSINFHRPFRIEKKYLRHQIRRLFYRTGSFQNR